MFTFLEAATAAPANAGTFSTIYMVVLIVAMVVLMYFTMIRPQKKQQKKQAELMASIATGDSVLTTAGFYGVVIDVMEEVIIVEFGNNKNCRIPMKKSAIVEVEKPAAEEPAAK